MIQTFDKATCRMLGSEIEDAVQAVAKKHGINIKYRGGNFDSHNAVLKVELSTVSATGEVNSMDAVYYRNMASYYQLKPEWLHKTFRTTEGKEMEIVGLKPRSHKYPVLVKDICTGKRWKYAVSQIKSLMFMMEKNA